MTRSTCYQFYAERTIDEVALIGALDEVLGIRCESLDVPDPAARCFVITQQYTRGFAQGVNVCWPADLSAAASRVDTARALAVRFGIQVATDYDDDGHEPANYYRWWVAEPDGTLVEMTEDPIERRSPDGLVLDPATRRRGGATD
jgi:hypothetical protein